MASRGGHDPPREVAGIGGRRRLHHLHADSEAAVRPVGPGLAGSPVEGTGFGGLPGRAGGLSYFAKSPPTMHLEGAVAAPGEAAPFVIWSRHCGAPYAGRMPLKRGPWHRLSNDGQDEGVAEDVVVRQYRYLLTTAPVDALEGLHAEVLGVMSDAQRRALLKGLSDAFATGGHVQADELRKVAHLVAVGAHRHPRAWIESLEPRFARHLAQAALEAEASYGRLNGYAYWDGTSPESVEAAGPNDGFNPSANRYRVDADPRFNVFGGGGIGGGG